MLCPNCLRDTSGQTCHYKDCAKELPPLYIQDYKKFSHNPSIFSIVGFSGHGKTVYLASMMYALEKILVMVWPRFYRLGLDEMTANLMIQNSMLLNKGELPEPTRRVLPAPSIHLLNEIPNYGTRGLVIYDPPGEAFNSEEGIKSYAEFVKRARGVIFLVSLRDLQEPRTEDLYRLLNIYILGMARMQAKTKDQHLIVVYTKADLLVEDLTKYQNVVNHLNADYRPLQDPKKYVRMLQLVSNDLISFTEKDLGAINFMRSARDKFKSVVFCTVSALGSAPEDGHMGSGIQPRGVVDPLIWVLERS